jgi:imidazolonepropionase
MIRADLVVLDAAQMLTLKGPAPRTRDALRDLSILPGGCLAARDGRLVFVGTRDAFEAEVSLDDAAEIIDATDQVVMPGFVDAHTHLPFAGSREKEFAQRLAGVSYAEIARAGGGIMSTVRATRAAGDEELLDLILRRMDRMLLEGVTSCEAKSGYGLTLEHELRLLRLLRRAAGAHPLEIAATFLGAHTVPAEMADNREIYIRLVIDEMIPAVVSEGLARHCDVFCEKGAFDNAESRRILTGGAAAGLIPRLHADQLSGNGGAELAAELGAASADHLEHASDEGLRRMAAAGVPAVLLPGASLCLMQEVRGSGRRVVEAGVAPVLATDLNPGTSYTESMGLMIALGCVRMGLTPEEAIAAATINPAVTIGREDAIGSLEPGKQADLIVLEAPDYRFLPYRPGMNLVGTVVKQGEVVVRDGRIVYQEPGEEQAT